MQAVIIPISDLKHGEAARALAERMMGAGLRVEVDDRKERMQAKIRDAQLQKVPYMLIMGDRDIEANAVSLRTRNEGDLGQQPIDEVIARIVEEVRTRKVN